MATISFLPDLASRHFSFGCRCFLGPVGQPILLFLSPPCFVFCTKDYKLINTHQLFSKPVFILFFFLPEAIFHTDTPFLVSWDCLLVSMLFLRPYCPRELYQTLIKDGEKDFVVDGGERMNLTLLKQKAGGFLSTEVSSWKALEDVREEAGE